MSLLANATPLTMALSLSDAGKRPLVRNETHVASAGS